MALRITTYYQYDRIPDFGEGALFHSREFFELIGNTPGYEPRMFVAYENECYVGRLLCVLRKSWLPIPFARRCTVYDCGDYVVSSEESNRIFDELLSYMTLSLKEEVSLFEFRNLRSGMFGYKSFVMNGYFPIRWLSIRNQVHNNQMDRWLTASRRRQIQRALQAGVQMRVARTETEKSAAYKMLKAFYASKWHKNLPDEAFFTTIVKQTAEQHLGHVIQVIYREKVIGVAVCLYSGSSSYLFYSGGMRKTYPHLYPGVMAVWFALLDARYEGKRYLEFIDVGMPYRKYGFRDFVLRFGGQQRSTRRWYRFEWGWLNRIACFFYR